MGRQVNFFLHPDDEAEFYKLLRSCGDFVVLSYYHFDNKISTLPDTIIRDPEKDDAKIYLARVEDLNKITLKYIEKFKYWLIDETSSPVLDFDRSIFKDNIIHSGRLYFQPQFVNSMEWIKKTDDYIRWADNIIKTVRRKLKKHRYNRGNYSYVQYLGEHALVWL